MNLLGGIIVAGGFIVLLKLLSTINRGKKVLKISRSAVTIIRNPDLDDQKKEKAMQKHAVKLLSSFFLITITSIFALAVPLFIIWLMELANLTTINEVIKVTLSFKFIAVLVIIVIIYLALSYRPVSSVS